MSTMHKPVDEETRRRETLELQQRMAEIQHKLLVLSGKGGVGKSTVAVNLAVGLAKAGQRVGLLDVDIHGPSIPKLTGLEGQTVHSDGRAILPVKVADNLAVMSIGFLLGSKADAVIWRGPLKYNVIRQFLKDVAWGTLDYLIIWGMHLTPVTPTGCGLKIWGSRSRSAWPEQDRSSRLVGRGDRTVYPVSGRFDG